MASGPDHYREAERLLSSTGNAQEMAARQGASGATLVAALEHIVAQAQVHATLALVAATVAERVTAPANSPDVLLSAVTDDWSVTR